MNSEERPGKEEGPEETTPPPEPEHPPRRERCYCGIDVDDANCLCTERHCPYKRQVRPETPQLAPLGIDKRAAFQTGWR